MLDDIRIPWVVAPDGKEVQAFFKTVQAQMTPRVLAFAHKLTGDWHSAEDCVQEVFSAFWKELPDFTQDTSLVPWLLTTARNLAFKSNQRVRLRFMVDLEKLNLMSDGRNPLSFALSKEQSGQLKKLIQTLPDQQRKAFLMRAVEGASYEEIGNILGCTEESAKKAYMRATKALRDITPADLCENFFGA